MATCKPQYRRLLNIDERLRAGAYPNCSNLAADWEVTRKTIFRDIEYLRWQLGAPIEYDAIRHGYAYTEPNYALPAISISESDLFAVFIAEQALKQFEDTPLYAALTGVFAKIEAALPDNVSIHPSWADSRITIVPPPKTRISTVVWHTIAVALRESRRLRITYRASGRAAGRSRQIEPYHLVGHKGQWYVIALCHRAGAVRTFALSRMRRVALLKGTFAMPKQFSLKKMLNSHFGIIWGETSRTVRVRFLPELAPYISERQWHAGQKIRHGRDGAIILEFNVNHLTEVKNWILSWGPGARALAPRDLVKTIKADLQRALQQYNGRAGQC